MKKFLLSYFLIFLFTSIFLYSYNSSSPFLQQSFDARRQALGNATTSICRGVESLLANPAGLVEEKHPQIFSSHGDLGWGRKYNTVGFSFQKHKWGIGFLWKNFTITGIPLTSQNNSTIVGTLNDGSVIYDIETIGYTEDKSNIFSLGLSRYLTSKWNLGFTLNYFRRNLYTYSADTFLFDVGLKYHYSRRLTLSMSSKNLGGKLHWPHSTDKIDYLFTTGISYQILPNLTIETDFLFPEGENLDLNLGIETQLKNRITLRGGSSRGKWTAGIGIILSNWEISYSYNEDDLSGHHQISAKTTLDNWNLPFQYRKRKKKGKFVNIPPKKQQTTLPPRGIVTKYGTIPLLYQKSIDGELYLELHGLKLLGMAFQYEEKTGIIRISFKDKNIMAKINETNILINKKEWQNITYPPRKEKGKIYLPLKILDVLKISYHQI